MTFDFSDKKFSKIGTLKNDFTFFNNNQKNIIPLAIPAGLKEITTIELFTQNYLKYDHISFTVWKRIKFYVYPPGARLSRPSHLFTQRLYFFCKISDPIRIGPGADPDRIQNLKNTFILIWVTNIHFQLYRPRGMTSYTKKSSNHEIEKIMVHLLQCAESFFILCIFY